MRVQWVGGPEDGGMMDIPDEGRSIDVIIRANPLPEAFVHQHDPDEPPDTHMRVARVPIVLRDGQWVAEWSERIERDT